MGRGEIDFIVASSRTNESTRPWNFEGRKIALETPWETAIKKIFYRSSTFKVRDVFDLAAVIDHHAAELRQNLKEVEDRLERLMDRLDAMAQSYANAAVNDINSTELGRKYLTSEAVDSVISLVADWRKQPPPDVKGSTGNH